MNDVIHILIKDESIIKKWMNNVIILLLGDIL